VKVRRSLRAPSDRHRVATPRDASKLCFIKDISYMLHGHGNAMVHTQHTPLYPNGRHTHLEYTLRGTWPFRYFAKRASTGIFLLVALGIPTGQAYPNSCETTVSSRVVLSDERRSSTS
jgi:hypothetical protein